MPPLPVPGTIVRLNMGFSMTGTPKAMNRIYVKYSGTIPTAANLATFSDACMTAWGTNMSPLQAPGTTMGPFSAQDLSSGSGAFGTGTLTRVGTRAGNVTPAATCANVRFVIARRYRGGKPKAFIAAGMVNDLATNATWAGAFVTAMTTGWNNWITAVLAASWAGASSFQHVNISYYSGFHVVTDPISGRARNVPTLRGTPLVDGVAGYSVDNQLGSQRRRNLNT